EVSTTMAFVRLLRDLMRDRELGPHVVPIIPDEGRTFGMESLFKDVKIYSPMGQRYEPVDANMLLSYAEARTGQILEEGITEAGPVRPATPGRPRLCHPRRPHGALLPLLLDVRLPAGGRPDLGLRRRPGAGFPARLHRRPDDAERRGAPARGRPVPPPRRPG